VKPVVLSTAALVLTAVLLAPLSWEPSARAPVDVPVPAQPTGSNPGEAATDNERELFPPENLVLLEVSDRAVWQEPEFIMDELLIAEASEVADIGAGSGWFTMRLAQRVGPNGTVYAQDVQQEMVTAITRRIEREKLTNVRVVRGDDKSPNLPHDALDAVLVVDVYPEVRGSRVGFLQTLADALRPRGRIGIVNHKPGAGGPGPEPESRVSREVVEDEAREAGLRVISTLDLRYQYLVVLARR
jgi:SAM-dependent methyltransferase